jgi:hypothetical protein
MGNFVSAEDNKFQEKGDYVSPEQVYSKPEADLKFQPKGNYALMTQVYNKTEVDTNFQKKGDYALINEVYKKPEADLKFQPKGDYALKTELAAFQPKGDYALKTELAAFQSKGDYALKSDLQRHALVDTVNQQISGVNAALNVANINNNSAQQKITDINNRIQTQDIRSNHQAETTPESYFVKGKGTHSQFTEGKLLGLPLTGEGQNDYVVLITHVPYTDPSGGPLYQYAYRGRNIVYTRVSSGGGWEREKWKDVKWGDWVQTNVFPKITGFNNPAIQIGETNEGRDDNIYSLSFGKAEGGTYTGMGLIPADKKGFTATTAPILGTHIRKGSEWGLYSDGWDKLVNIEGTTGNMKIKGEFTAPNIPTKTEIDTKINGLVNNNTLNDIKPQTLWCASGEVCDLPVGKLRIQFPSTGVVDSKQRMHISSDKDIFLLTKGGDVNISKAWGGNGHLNTDGGITVGGGQLRTPPGPNLCNSNGTICVDVADIKNVIDTAVRKS